MSQPVATNQMSSGSSPNPFPVALDLLIRSGDRTRAVVYLFVVINSIMFVIILGTALVPVADIRMNAWQSLLSCFETHNYNAVCDRALPLAGEESAEFGSKKEMESILASDYNKTQALSMFLKQDRLILENRMAVEQQQRLNFFVLPIFGVNIDEAFLWVISSFVGVFGMLVLNRAIASEAQNFELALRLAPDTCIDIVASTRMLSYYSNPGRSGLIWAENYIQRSILYAIALIPIGSQIIIVFDRYHYMKYEMTIMPLFYPLSAVISLVALAAMFVLALRTFIILRSSKVTIQTKAV
jgi:hypothetical protein